VVDEAKTNGETGRVVTTIKGRRREDDENETVRWWVLCTVKKRKGRGREEAGKRKGSTKNGGREWGKREERCSGGHVLVDPAQFDGVANALDVLLVVVSIELGSFGVGGTAEVRKVSVGFRLNWW
jgi:hypothetical protein